MLLELNERTKGHEEGKQDGNGNSLPSLVLPSNLSPSSWAEVGCGK